MNKKIRISQAEREPDHARPGAFLFFAQIPQHGLGAAQAVHRG